MLRKPQIVATLPDHVVVEIAHYAAKLHVTKSEYLSLIARDWFSRGCPAVSAEEAKVRENTKSNRPVAKHI